MRLAARLREADVRVVVQHGRRSLKAQMRQAQKLGVSAVLILGEEEMASGHVAVRDMLLAEQSVVPEEGVGAAVAQILGGRLVPVGGAG